MARMQRDLWEVEVEEEGIGFGGEWEGGREEKVVVETVDGGMRGMVKWW